MEDRVDEDDVVLDAQEQEQYACKECKNTFAADEVYDVGGQYICRACYDRQIAQEPAAASAPAGPQPTPQPSPQPATAPAPRRAAPPVLRANVTCPHCWHRFAPEDVLWISEHADLLGDVVLGEEAPLRFLPSRFTVDGDAVDARGMRCQLLACPHCHLQIPRGLLESETLLLSIAGVPASGKTYLLAAMAWELRQLLAREFAIAFTDADALANRSLHEYEETLFMPPDANRLVAIRKTELQGELYDQVNLNSQLVTLPRPFLLNLRLTEVHPGYPNDKAQRLLCLYDNAGEHFQAGADSAANPVTHHLERSRVLMFVYDPTQDPNFRRACQAFSDDPQLRIAPRTQRQETVLTETANRVRRLAHIPADQKYSRPLLVILAKSDVWSPLVDADVTGEPLFRKVVASNLRPNHLSAVDVLRIEATSQKLRTMLMEYAPQLVTAAEDFSSHVVYIAVSALGHAPEIDAASGMLGIRPRNIHPHWVTAPILYILSRWATGLVAGNQFPPKPGAQAHGS